MSKDLRIEELERRIEALKAERDAALGALKNAEADRDALHEHVAQLCELCGDRREDTPCDTWRLAENVQRLMRERDAKDARIAELSPVIHAMKHALSTIIAWNELAGYNPDDQFSVQDLRDALARLDPECEAGTEDTRPMADNHPAVEAMDRHDAQALVYLNRLRAEGYSVQVSTCRDTGMTAKWGGLPGWTCSVKSLAGKRDRTEKQGIRVRIHMFELADAVTFAYQEADELGGINHA